MSTVITSDATIPQDLVERALLLPASSREKLGHILLASLTPNTGDEDANRILIRSRLQQLINGEAELLDADDVIADLEKEFGTEASP